MDELKKRSYTAQNPNTNPRLNSPKAKNRPDYSSTPPTTPQTDTTLPTGPVQSEIIWHAPFTTGNRETDYSFVWRKLEEKDT